MNQKNIFFIDMETSGLYNPLDKGYPQILSFGACAYDFE
jgi:DNA polymerase III epsilon subunit-like protein